jgi:hypothetical protein
MAVMRSRRNRNLLIIAITIVGLALVLAANWMLLKALDALLRV